MCLGDGRETILIFNRGLDLPCRRALAAGKRPAPGGANLFDQRGRTASSAPQRLQNNAPAGFSTPQREQAANDSAVGGTAAFSRIDARVRLPR